MDSIAFLILAWILRQLGGGSPSKPSKPAQSPIPPTFPGPKPVPVAPGAAVATTYTIRSGDTPFGLAQRYAGAGGRWKEILTANPTLSTTTSGGVTQITPWQIGQVITWPSGWAQPGSGASPGSGGRPNKAPPPKADPGMVDNPPGFGPLGR